MKSFWAKTAIGSLISSVVIILGLVVVVNRSNADTAGGDDENLEGLTLVDLIRKFGFIAEEHHVITSDGYNITLTRMVNPLIVDSQNKTPMLFMPGETATGGMFIANADGARPKDFTGIDAGNLTLDELIEKFGKEPSAKSFAMLCSNLGRDIWFGSRRGYPTSQGHIDPSMTAFYKKTDKVGETDEVVTDCCLSGNADDEESCDPIESLRAIITEYQKSVNRRYWNFTLDHESLLDVGDSINYILKKTGFAKLDLVGHSSGAAINLMVVIGRPEFEEKVSNLVLYAPTIYQDKYARLALDAIQPALDDYLGPFATSAVTNQISCLIDRSCLVKYGNTKDDNGNLLAERCQEPQIIYKHQNGYAVGNQHTTQLLQNLGKKMHYFDYGSFDRNMIKYGQPEAPLYDVGAVTKPKVSIYYGSLDPKITPVMGKRLIADFKVSVDVHYFDDPKLEFAHGSPLFHKDVAILVVLPSVMQVQAH